MLFIAQSCPRETVTLDDGGILCLDWSEPLHQKRDSTKILLFMAGLTGGSRENYATLICHKANTLGYIAVVMNNRGCADAPLTVGAHNIHSQWKDVND